LAIDQRGFFRKFLGAKMTISSSSKSATPSIDELIIGQSEAVQRLRALVTRVAACGASVLLAGASGSGKELVAQAIHMASMRAAKPFVAINCGAIPADLIESELFGHEKGSFTGAHSRRIGHFESADKGTLFLDEIGDMRFDMQVKLLRVLEERKVVRVGGSSAIPVDVRIISATHQDIDMAMADGHFRQDLFFRLGVVILRVPDLASRTEDIPLLIRHFQRGKPAGVIANFDESGMARLQAHSWPGNVRELRNFVERAGVLMGGATLDADAVGVLIAGGVPAMPTENFVTPVVAPSMLTTAENGQPIDLKQEIEMIELMRIHTALEQADGIISEAARLLTLKRTTLIEKMRKYGLQAAA
jgi:sigma-54 dependent transcriptional regulator, flagellar regulatory protein